MDFEVHERPEQNAEKRASEDQKLVQMGIYHRPDYNTLLQEYNTHIASKHVQDTALAGANQNMQPGRVMSQVASIEFGLPSSTEGSLSGATHRIVEQWGTAVILKMDREADFEQGVSRDCSSQQQQQENETRNVQNPPSTGTVHHSMMQAGVVFSDHS